MGRREHGSGSVYQSKDGQWWARVPLGGGKYRRARCAGRKEAERQVAAWLKELEAGTDLRAARLSLRAYLERWLTEQTARGDLAPRTLEFYRRHADYAVAYIGHVALEGLEPAHWRTTQAALRKDGLSPRSVNHVQSVLNNALNQAVKDRAIQFNPVALVDRLKLGRDRFEAHVLSDAEIAALLAACEPERLGIVYHFILDHGVRHGEARALRWADVDLDAGTLAIRVSKSDAGRRSLPLTAAWVDRLRAHFSTQAEERSVMKERWKEHGYVFPGETGAQLSEPHSTKVFHRILRRAGLCAPCLACKASGAIGAGKAATKCAACSGHGSLTYIRVHDLRHTAITDWIAEGADPKAAQALAGHSSADVTMEIYAKARGGKLRGAVEAVEEARERRRKKKG